MYDREKIKILGIIQATVKQHGVKMLASRLQVTPQTLYADVDPNSIGRRTNKLGFLDWLITLEETRDLSSLEAANRLFNRLCLPIPPPTEEMTEMCWMSFCATIAKESGEAVAELAASILSGNIDKHDLERCEKEAMDALEAFAGLYLAIKDRRLQGGQLS
jgi:hypothetical protein